MHPRLIQVHECGEVLLWAHGSVAYVQRWPEKRWHPNQCISIYTVITLQETLYQCLQALGAAYKTAPVYIALKNI